MSDSSLQFLAILKKELDLESRMKVAEKINGFSWCTQVEGDTSGAYNCVKVTVKSADTYDEAMKQVREMEGVTESNTIDYYIAKEPHRPNRFGVLPYARTKKIEDAEYIELPIFGMPNSIDEAIQYAAMLQKRQCCYGTTDGDGHPCDCKFLGPPNGEGGEATGCCEARGLIHYLRRLKAQGQIQ